MIEHNYVARSPALTSGGRMEGEIPGEPSDTRMTSRDGRIYQELQRLDPHLAGLFRQGVEYIDRVHEPGGIYMLSHAGRELSAAVIRLFSGEGDPLSEEEASRAPEGEGHRKSIASALGGLSVQHPSVTTWMRTHQALHSTAHFRSPAPTSEAVQRTIEAFRTLTDILFGRVGLYFDARGEIDALLELTDPGPEDVERLRALAMRPQLRQAFFHQLRHTGWLEPLRETGLFQEAPELGVDSDTGNPTALPWPEGQYLVRIAPEAPAEVVTILLDVPDRIRNPVVWRSVADAALRLPAAEAARLANKLERALDHSSSYPMVARGVFAVAQYLAEAQEGNALILLRALTSVSSAEDTDALGTSKTGQVATLPNMRHTARPTEILELVANIADLRSRATVANLCSKLHSMLTIEHGEPGELPSPVHDRSRSWARSIGGDPDRSATSLVAAAVLRAAQVASTQADAGPEWVLERLSRYPWLIFLRLRLAYLASAPVIDQPALNAAIGDLSRLDDQPVLPEYRQLIRAHFDHASPETRKAVADHILSGPQEEPDSRAERDPDEEDGDDPGRARREHWQRHLLRLFGSTPPPELEALAQELGTVEEVLSTFDRDLDEHGFAVGVGAGRGPESPLGIDALRAMSTSEVLEYLRTFVAEPGWNAPTPAGLAAVMARQVHEDPSWAAPLLERIIEADVHPTYVRGLLEGLLNAIRAGREIPWRESLGLVAWVASQPPERGPEGSPGHYLGRSDPGLTWARNTATDLLIESTRGDLLPPENLDELWIAVEKLFRVDATWESVPASAGTMDEVLQLESSLGGKAAEALLLTALRDYRLWEREDGQGDWNGRERLRPLLEMLLDKTGGSGVGARSVLGRYLPQLMLIDRAWLDHHRERVLERAVEAPFQNPVFASYVVRGRLYGDAFQMLRQLYEAAVVETGREGNEWTAGEESFRPGRYLLEHLLGAYRFGWLELEQDGELINHAFTSARPEDVNHLWWSHHRSWADSGNRVLEEQLNRVVSFWDRRLTRLEQEKGARARQEAEGFGWLAMADAIPDEILLPLLLRTARVSAGNFPIAGRLWERLARLAVLDVPSAMEVAVSLIGAELAGEFPYFNLDEVAPVLRVGLRSGDVVARGLAERAIHSLGENGFEQFGDLLREERDHQEPPPPR